jgi:hypothetical protein
MLNLNVEPDMVTSSMDLGEIETTHLQMPSLPNPNTGDLPPLREGGPINL